MLNFVQLIESGNAVAAGIATSNQHQLNRNCERAAPTTTDQELRSASNLSNRPTRIFENPPQVDTKQLPDPSAPSKCNLQHSDVLSGKMR